MGQFIMFLLSICAAVLVPVTVFTLMLASPLKLTGTLAVSAGLLLLAWMYSPALAVYLSGLLLATLFCGSPAFRPQHPVTRILAVLAVFAVMMGAWRQANRDFYHGKIQRRAELREDYPIESLKERLAVLHPQESGSGKNRPPVVAPVPLSQIAGSQLKLREQTAAERWWLRQSSLERIHDLKRDEFLKAAGFGSIRMRSVSREHLKQPVSEPVMLPEPPPSRPAPSFGGQVDLETAADADDGEADDEASPAAGLLPVSQLERTLNSVYLNGLEDFTDPNQLGYVPQPQHAAGFLPHSVDALPMKAREANGTTEPATPGFNWQITRLELVSLLKHAGPVVYESRELPRMDRLANAPTRPLTGFERRSLRELRGERDLVTDEHNGRVLMLGAIRAARQCLDCHSVPRGTLLGAFSYEIWLPGAAPVEAPPTEDLPPAT